MRRIAVVVGLCALLLPMMAWADGINLTNQYGTLIITNSGITNIGSELKSYGSTVAAAGNSLGTVTFTTGALISGGLWTGGTFSATGSTFDITGAGLWAKKLTGQAGSSIALFTGSFSGPIAWTLVNQTGKYKYYFTLSGAIAGMLYDGRNVTGTTTQNIFVYQNQWYKDGKGSIGLGYDHLNIPEPGTLVLFGTGVIAFAGMVRRKLLGS